MSLHTDFRKIAGVVNHKSKFCYGICHQIMAVSAGRPKFSAMGVNKLNADLKKVQLAVGKLEHL